MKKDRHSDIQTSRDSRTAPTISLIVTTYNRPVALDKVFHSISRLIEFPHEIIIADDGSTADTADVIDQWRGRLPCRVDHAWQEDCGFRAARIRNLATNHSTGDYLVYLDGDCLIFPDFITQHRQLAESGYFVAGNRILLSKQLTENLELSYDPPTEWSLTRWLKARYAGDVNRLSPLIRLGDRYWRKIRGSQWQGVRTCNLGVWREDLSAVNGFDEQFIGWGHEDADLAVRLIKYGSRRKDGRFAVPVLHLWHKENPRNQERTNWEKLNESLANKSSYRALQGLNETQH